MAIIEQRRVLPTTRYGAIGALLAGIAIVAFILVMATNGPDSGRNPLAFTWGLVLLSGAFELVAIIRYGERSILGFVALLPVAILAVLLFMEATGLME
jgi:hypothetical protein